MRYFASIAYDGTAYSGWQLQPNAPTVQAELEKALTTLLRTETPIVGCGRTDAGVHASNYIIHFDGESGLGEDQIVYKLNALLPDAIAVHAVRKVRPQAHARYDAVIRKYSYYIGFEKNPLYRYTTYFLPKARELDFQAMNSAAALLLGQRSFKSFCKEHSGLRHYRCHLYSAEWFLDEKTVEFKVSANRFLRGMVRLLVGALLEVGQGKVTPAELLAIVEAEARLKRPFSVPAQGLHFTDVQYPEQTFAQP